MVYVLPGIEGKSRNNIHIAQGLVQGGVHGAVQIYDWTTGGGALAWFVHLADRRRNRIQAFRLARLIVRYQQAYPDRPVFLVAHSGGAGIALMAVENLPKTTSIEGVILLAGAVSPERNLCRALAHTRRGIWNFYSKRDIGFLVVGTSLFGTMDRKHEPSAGAVGFTIPQELTVDDAELYAQKLHQVPYDPLIMKRYGHKGGHNGWVRPAFVANWLAPIILNSTNSTTHHKAAAKVESATEQE